jgi:hypothetical protein
LPFRVISTTDFKPEIRGASHYLKIAQGVGDVVRRRRDDSGFGQSAAACADPVLAVAQFSRREMRAADTVEELLMNFADQAHRDRQVGEPLEPVVHCPDVVDDLAHVTGPGATPQ